MVNVIARSVLLLALASPLVAQEHDEETRAAVPALQKYHAVIYPLWHTAWPAKDTAMMAKLLPDIEKGAAAVKAASLPGILRDKKAAWDGGVGKLDDAVTAYRSAVEAGDREKLLAAAEALHARYEGLVRIVRPVLKELDAFHTTLYMLYHYYWPENNLAKIRESAAALGEKMAALDTAALPKRLEPKTAAFTAGREKLGKAVRGLQEIVSPSYDDPSPADLKSAVTWLHTCYQDLERVFD
jgi:hypothetical protein